MKYTKIKYQSFLNDLGTPSDDLKSNGGRIKDRCLYGSWLRRNDPIAFEVGFRDWKSNF